MLLLRLAMAAVALSCAAAMADDLGLVEQLPPPLRHELHELHQRQKRQRGGAGKKAFDIRMDARLLLEHVRDRVPLSMIRFVGRNKRAARTRWNEHLKDELQNLNTLRTLSPDADMCTSQAMRQLRC